MTFRFSRWLILAALFTTIPAVTAAQVVTTTDPYDDAIYEEVPSHWLASGFVGSNFGSDADETSADFGGSIGYLWNGTLGGEFVASFAPEFQLDAPRSALLGGEQPWVNSYMVNAIGAIPLGEEGRWRPYVSGGIGALTLRADALTVGDDNEIEPDDTRGAGNIGVGLMGFAGNWGIRGDVRYFRGFESDEFDLSDDSAIGEAILSNLEFWRANVGIAVRW